MFKIGKFGKKVVSAVIAGAVVLGTLAVYPGANKNVVLAAATKYDSTSAINYKTILGGAVDYGIVSSELLQNSHLETTFATNHFSNMGDGERGHAIEVDYTTSPALFIINSLDRGSLFFNKTTSSELYVEAPESVFGSNYDPSYVVPPQGGKNGNFWFGNEFNNVPVVQAVNADASSNVNRLIERINRTTEGNKGWSYFLSDRAKSPEYRLNDGNTCENIKLGGKLEVDITDSKFDGKVVYINLTADMVNYLKNDGDFVIRKNPSSIVVFNIEEDAVTDSELVMKKPIMYCEGEKYSGTTATNGHNETYNWNGEHSANVNAAAVQKVFNETVIWNVMTAKPVTLQSMGGTMLFPNSDLVTLKEGNCSGWIVAKGTVDAKIQFHFLYNGTTRDSYGQMHFALRKAMTQAYAPKTSVVQDTSVSINKGDFKFYIQEYTDDTYSTTYGTKKAVSVDENAIATFPTLSFYSDDTGLTTEQKHYYLEIPSGTEKTTKTFYFKISEDPLKTVPGIENSDGYINVELKVSLDHNKNFTYEVKHLSVTGENIVYNDETADYVKMSGVQFDLGAFYNKVNEHLGALTINKNVKLPDGTGNLDSDKTYYFTVSRVIGGTTYYYDQEGNPSTTEVKIPVTVSADTKKGDGTVSNLPEGTYTVKEVVDNAAKTVSAGGTTYTLTTTVDETSTVNVVSGQFNPVSVTNNYEESQDEGSLTINKVVQGRQIQQGEEFKFRVTSTDGYDEVITVKAQNNYSNPTVTINKLPLSTYTIQEIAPVTGEVVNISGTNYRLTGVTGNNHSIELNDGSKTGILTVENTYEQVTQNLGTIAIVKQIAGITPDQANNLDPIKFTVSGPDGFSATVTYPDDFTNGRWSQSNVPHGEYTVTETANGATSTYTFVSTKVSSSNNQSQVTATSRTDTLNGNNNSTLSINFTNTYEYKAPETGALKLQKTVDGPDGCVAANTEFTFYVKGEDGKWYDKDGNPSNQKVGIKVKAGASNAVTIDPLPVQKYDITEDDATNTATENYEFVSADSTVSQNDVAVSDNATASATLINKYVKKTLQPGSLTLQKTVDGPSGCVDPDTEFTFYVKGEDGKWYDENGDAYDFEIGIQIKAGETNKITISNIPAQKYEIYEADASSAAETDYEYVSGESTKTLSDVEVPAGGSNSAILINKYKKSAPTKGSLTLKKTVDGDTGCADPDTEFTFYVKGADGKWYDENGAPSDQKVGIKIKAGDANIITINNLPAQKYDITEDDATSTAAAGYEYDSNNSTKSLTDVEVKAGETTPSELINKYVRSKGGLSLTKTVPDTSGCNATEFTFYVKGADGKWYDETGAASDTEVGITVPVNGTVTITSIPVQKYTITEADAAGTAKTGYEVDSANSTVKLENVSVTKGAVASAELTNAYKRSTGKLTLIKTISGETAGANTGDFTFYVKGEDGKWYDENGDPSTTQVGITVPAGTAGVTIENLPTQKYTITEADATTTAAAGYEYDATGSTTEKKDVEVAANATATAELINKYKTSEGSLKLLKTISGETAGANTGDFTFYVKGEDGKWYDENGDPSTTQVGITVPAGTTGVTISGLPVQKYTITEADATGTAKAGYEYDAAGSTTEKKDVEVTANATATAELINKYKASTGSLKLLKTISGETAGANTSNFTFYVKGEDGKWYDENGDPSTTQVGITVPAGTAGVTISGLPVQKYTITEADATGTAKAGYEYDAAGSTTEKKDVEVTANATANAELINRYKTSEGKLTLIKTIDGPSGCTNATEFTFYVKGEDGKWYDENGDPSDTEVGVLVTAGTAGVTISGLPVQKYTITEADASATAASGFEYDAAGSTTEKKDVEVTANATASAELINKYKEIKGSLTLKKTIDAPAGYTTTKTFKFYVKGEDGKWYDKDGKASASEVYVEVPANGTVKIDNLPLQKYDVTEADATGTAETGYTYDATNSTTEKKGVEVTANATATAELINAYKVKAPDTGSLQLKKTISAPSGYTTSKTFKFYVKGADGKWYDKDGTPSDTEVYVEVPANGTVKIDNLPLQKYDVTEADATGTAESGYTYDASNSTTEKKGITVTASAVATAELTNAYKQITGSLKLKKTVSGPSGSTTTNNFTFYVKGEDGKWYDKNGDPSTKQVGITVKGNDTNGVTISGLPVQKYDITEDDGNAAAASGYELDGSNSDVSKPGIDVTQDTTTTVTLINAYKTKEVDKGSLVLKKTVSGPDGSAATNNFTFYVKGEDGKWYDKNGKASDTQVGITVPAGTTGVTVDNLPVQKYDITEKTEGTAANGYEIDGANSVTSKPGVDVTKDAETEVTLVNAYKTKENDTGSLILKKTVSGEAGGANTTKFTFYVKGENGKWYDKDGTASDTQVGITVDSSDTDGVEVKNLPVQKYDITEKTSGTASSGYELDTANSDTSKDDVEVVKDTATTVTLVNAYKTKEVDKGSLILKKKVTGESGGANTTSFTFYVKGEDGKWYDKDGKASSSQVGITVSSSDDDGVEVKNLPVQKYDITEKTSGTASNGYELDTANSDTSKDNVEVAKDTATTVTLTNSYKKKEVDKGSLELRKKIQVPEGCKTTTFTFYVKGADGKWYGADGKASDDKVEITVTAGTPLTINDLPVQTYTVTEKTSGTAADNYELDGENSITTRTNISVEKDQTATAELINSYKKSTAPETGSIKVSKVENGSVPTSGIPSSYSFLVKCGTQYLKADGTFGDKSDAKVFKVAPGDETEVTGLELGKTYTVEEVSYNIPDGYEVSVTYSPSKSVTLDSTNKSDSVKITNTYISKGAPLKGSIVVTKRLAGSVPSSGMPDTYRFYIKCGDQYVQSDSSLGENKYMFSIAPNKSLVIIDLDTDNKTYEIVEEPISNSDLPDGYKWSVSYSAESVTLKTPDDSGEVTIINNYTHKAPSPNEDKGSLALKKTVSGPSGCTNTSSFTFYVKGADKKWYDKNAVAHADQADAAITVKAGETVTISNLPVQTYTVTEKNPADTAADGFEIDGNKSVPTRVNVEVVKDGTAEAELINAYKTSTVDTGSLILKKSVTGEAGGAKTTEFTFYVKGADGKWYDKDGNASSTKVGITVKSTDTDGVKISKLPVQKYDITEDTSNTASDGYELDTANSDTSKEKVAVTKDNETTVTLINSYKTKTVDKGSLKLIKDLKTPAGAKTTSFTFYVKGADGKWYDKDGNASSTKTGITVSSTDTNGVTVDNLPVQKYDITEDTDGTAADNYELDTANSDTSKEKVDVTKDNTTTVTLVNAYKTKTVQETGDIILKKTVSGDSGCTKTTDFTFYVKGEDGKWYDKDGNASSTKVGVTVSSTDTNGVKISGIPAQKYDITEDTDNTAADNYELDGNSSETSKTGVTVTKDTTPTVTLINAYKKSSVQETGNLVLKKTVSGEAGGAKTTDFTFYVKGADGKWYDKDGNASSTKVGVTVSSTDANGVTIKDIPVQKYDITEDYSGTAADNYELDTSKSTTSRSGVTVTATTPGEAELINNYKKQTVVQDKGNLSFTKTFSGDIKENEAAASSIYFVIERTDTTAAAKYLKLDGTFTANETEARIKLSDLTHAAGSLKWSVEIDNIPVGKYKVTESDAVVKIDGTNVELILVTGSSVTSQTANVTKDSTGNLDLINNYKVSDYDVKISKQDIAKKELPKATLTLTSLDGYDLSGAKVKQGSKTISVKVSSDKKSISFVTGTTPSLITGLRYGKYELKETVTPEAYLTADAIKFSIDRAGNLYDENGSVIVSGSPIVMIDRADPNYKKPTPSGNNKVPATGVGTSYAPVIGMILLAISIACGTAVVIFRTKKRKQ